MKIYFTAAISASNQFGDNYKNIVTQLKKLGHQVNADHILKADLNRILTESQKMSAQYYKEMEKNLKEADMLVAEVSFPSTVHVGHELTLALENDKPVLALFVKGKRPVLFWGITSDKFYASEYNNETLEDILHNSIDYLSDQQDVRFNFFISPQIGSYLDWISKQKRIPRAVYLRRLIEDDMRKSRGLKVNI